jgi:hypothetical protein
MSNELADAQLALRCGARRAAVLMACHAKNSLGLAGFEQYQVARAGPAGLAGLCLECMQANERKLEFWTHKLR